MTGWPVRGLWVSERGSASLGGRAAWASFLPCAGGCGRTQPTGRNKNQETGRLLREHASPGTPLDGQLCPDFPIYVKGFKKFMYLFLFKPI